MEVGDWSGEVCNSNGICTDLVNDYKCDCDHGYTGKSCEIDVDECFSAPCLNNGTCYQSGNEIGIAVNFNEFICDCQPGFTGYLCEMNVNECVLYNPCVFISKCTGWFYKNVTKMFESG